jgi:hypothetical protein
MDQKIKEALDNPLANWKGEVWLIP